MRNIIHSSIFYSLKFPADKFSISTNGRMKSGNEIVDVDEVVDGWVRATELYPNPRMIKNGLAREDVKQGKLGMI